VFRPSSYSAATSSEVCVRLEVGDSLHRDEAPPRILSVGGWCIDSIQHISNGYPLHKGTKGRTDAEIQRMFLVWHDSVRKCLAKATSSQKIAYDNIDEAFARTLLVDDLYTGKNWVSGAAASITDPVGCHARVLANLKRAREGCAPLRYVDYDWSEDSTFAQQAFAACPGRCFAVTARGFFCLVPAVSMVGDGVAIFSGAATPFIIRDTSPRNTGQEMLHINAELIGDAYVHGIMDGETIGRGETLQEIHLH
jgi:hypothetical protein